MPNDGRQLEALVAFVEKTLVPQGYEVKTNERVYNDDGVQIAELDVEVRGKVGSTTIAWLCQGISACSGSAYRNSARQKLPTEQDTLMPERLSMRAFELDTFVPIWHRKGV